MKTLVVCLVFGLFVLLAQGAPSGTSSENSGLNEGESAELEHSPNESGDHHHGGHSSNHDEHRPNHGGHSSNQDEHRPNHGEHSSNHDEHRPNHGEHSSNHDEHPPNHYKRHHRHHGGHHPHHNRTKPPHHGDHTKSPNFDNYNDENSIAAAQGQRKECADGEKCEEHGRKEKVVKLVVPIAVGVILLLTVLGVGFLIFKKCRGARNSKIPFEKFDEKPPVLVQNMIYGETPSKDIPPKE